MIKNINVKKILLISSLAFVGSTIMWFVIYFPLSFLSRWFSLNIDNPTPQIITEYKPCDCTSPNAENFPSQEKKKKITKNTPKARYVVEVSEEKELVFLKETDGEKKTLSKTNLDINTFESVIPEGNIFSVGDSNYIFRLILVPTGCVKGDSQNEFDNCVKIMGLMIKDYIKVGGIWKYNIKDGNFTHLVKIPSNPKHSIYNNGELQLIENSMYAYYSFYYSIPKQGSFKDIYILNIETGKSTLVGTTKN